MALRDCGRIRTNKGVSIMIVNKITFAGIAGVGKSSVTLSVQRGNLVATSDGFIDTENPVNAAYLEKRKGKTDNSKAVPAKEKRKPRKSAELGGDKLRAKAAKAVSTRLETLDGVDLPVDDLPDVGFDEPDAMDKLSVDIRLKTAQARRHELKFEQDKGNLIPVESVERAAAKVGSEIKIRLQDLPRRIAPRILAMARSGADDKEVQTALEREIDDGIEGIRAALGVSIG